MKQYEPRKFFSIEETIRLALCAVLPKRLYPLGRRHSPNITLSLAHLFVAPRSKYLLIPGTLAKPSVAHCSPKWFRLGADAAWSSEWLRFLL